MLNSCSRQAQGAFEKRLAALAGKLTVRRVYELFRKWKELMEAEAASIGDDGDACAASIDKLESMPGDTEGNQGSSGDQHHRPHRTSPDDDNTEKGVWVGVKMPVPVVALWDYALEWARRMEEAELPQGEFVELLLAEYLASCPVRQGSEKGEKRDKDAHYCSGHSHGENASSPHSHRHCDDLDTAGSDEERSTWKEIEKSLEETSRYWSFLPWGRINVSLDKELTPDPSWFQQPHVAAQKLREMRFLKESLLYHQGKLLRYMRNLNLQQELMFLTITHYARERLGMSENTVRSRIRMAGHFHDYPELEQEYLGKRLSQEQVMHLGKVFDAGTYCRDEWIDYAKSFPTLDLGAVKEEFLRLEELHRPEQFTVSPRELHRNRYSGFGIRLPSVNEVEGGISGDEEKEDGIETSGGLTLRFYVQAGLKELWGYAADFYREHCAAEGTAPCLAGFVEALLGSFIDTWCSSNTVGAIHELPLHIRNKLLSRDGYRCQVPGCSCRRFLEVHHIIYRSHGGSNAGDNLITLCGFHHRQCLHNGYLIIQGKAPGELTVILGVLRENHHTITDLETVISLARFRNGIRIRQTPPPSGCTAA